jgi:AP-4 complex subunit sigma-1
MVNKQGQTRLSTYFTFHTIEERTALESEIIRKCLSRTEYQCSFMEYRGFKVIYRRYASLFFIVGCDPDEEVSRALAARCSRASSFPWLPLSASPHAVSLLSFLSLPLSLSPPARSCGWPARSHSPSRTPLSRTRSQNELGILEFIHALVETLDKYFENVCELDIMFNLEKAHFIVEEMVMNGQIVETNKANILKPIKLIEDGS